MDVKFVVFVTKNLHVSFTSVSKALFIFVVCLWCVLSIFLLTMIIQSKARLYLSFSNALVMADGTCHKVYQQFTLTVMVMENMTCSLCRSAFK